MAIDLLRVMLERKRVLECEGVRVLGWLLGRDTFHRFCDAERGRAWKVCEGAAVAESIEGVRGQRDVIPVVQDLPVYVDHERAEHVQVLVSPRDAMFANRFEAHSRQYPPA